MALNWRERGCIKYTGGLKGNKLKCQICQKSALSSQGLWFTADQGCNNAIQQKRVIYNIVATEYLNTHLSIILKYI